jgi:hypothetical protein
MSDKVNGYQIRTDLLHLANRILESQIQSQNHFFEAKLNLAKSLSDLNGLTPPTISIDELLNIADRLNQFVQTK